MRVRRPGMKWDWQHGLAGLVQATQVPPVWRPPEGLAGLAAVLGGGGGAWPGFETTRPDTHSDTATPVWRAPEGLVGLAAVLGGGGGAWPGFETTRRAKLAARTARGRAAAHGHNQQPGPTKHKRRPEHRARAKRLYSPPPPGSGRPV